ncbi:MAG: hypothetical protein ACOZE7_03700 [Pseudomonadota bacterium]
MAQFKSIEATPQNIWKLQESLNSIDAATQDAKERIQALTAAIRLMVQQPDSGTLRLQISELCTAIDHAAFEAMNVSVRRTHVDMLRGARSQAA